jgi:hypothetical protein
MTRTFGPHQREILPRWSGSFSFTIRWRPFIGPAGRLSLESGIVTQNMVLEYSESLMIAGTFREIWREESFETCRAFASLSRAHQAGILIATGTDATSGVRRDISPREWCELQFVGIDLAAPEAVAGN